MVSKKSSFVIAAIVTIFSIIIVVYPSCKKQDNSPNVCENIVCQNNGYCHVDTTHGNHFVCVCPTGYEGAYCATVSVAKYIGLWTMTQTVIGSDSANFIGVSYKYTAYLAQTATPTTFFINNFSNVPDYNDIVCTLDSSASNHFFMDTISAYHMLYDHYKLLYGSGTISNNGNSISDTFATRHLSPTTNWIDDTFAVTLIHQ